MLYKWIMDKIVYNSMRILSEDQKQYIKNKLSLKQKELIKRLIGDQRYSIRSQVEEMKYKLLNLGFYEKAIVDLEELALDTSNGLAQKEASWELALWYADQHTPETAKTALSFLNSSLVKETDNQKLRQGAILQAELYHLLGKEEQAREVLQAIILKQSHEDLLLAGANLEESLEIKIQWINRLMQLYGLAEVQLKSITSMSSSPFDRLNTESKITSNIKENTPVVSIIMPVYNSEKVIKTALDSLLSQTWTNIELIIVDDCSADNTVEVIEEYVKQDKRIKLIQSNVNQGTYVARNIGLRVATGEFVTCHDADDWSHAEKIERQVTHLLQNHKVIANVSNQSRLTNGLIFYRRKQQRFYVFNNMSSLMFRRQKVVEKIGYWDSVRFGGDGEFIRRIRKSFGEESIVNICSAPLSFTRVSDSSLTENGPFGYYGYFFGVRKEYVESFSYYYQHGIKLLYEFPQVNRPFPIPHPMKPTRGALERIRHFDVIIVSDFRLTGGTTSSNIEEIKAQKQSGLRTGLVQMSSYHASVTREINPQIRMLLDGEYVQMLVYGENVTCDVLIVRHPPILQEIQKYIPGVTAKRVCVVVNQTPKVDYGDNSPIAYDIERCKQHLLHYFGQPGDWYPIGPLVRKALKEHHAKETEEIQLAEEDWVNIINVDEWKQEITSRNDSKIRIGRHSRDHYVKWPSDPVELLQIYPDSDPYEVLILGGAKIPEKTLGKQPRNWRVLEFGQKNPKEFLAEIDVFVYYIHPECIEAFGRVIIEAMATGVPVILPPSYRDLFKDAAIYAEPEEVKTKINILMNNSELYTSQIQKSLKYVSEYFDYSSHISRLKIGEQ